MKWYGFKGFPSHSSHCSGGLFPQYSGVSPNTFWTIPILNKLVYALVQKWWTSWTCHCGQKQNAFTKSCFGTAKFVKLTRYLITLQRKLLSMLSCKQGHTSSSNITQPNFWSNYLCNHFSGPVLRDTARLSQRYPPIARYGVFGVSTWPIGCDTPSPFSERFPLGEHAKWRCDTPIPPPPPKGVSQRYLRYPMKTRQMGAIPPSAILSRKGIARWGGGVSRTGPLR